MKYKFPITILVMLIVALIAAILVSAANVQAQPNAQATTTATPTAHTHEEDADPAHAYCEEKGGTVTTRFPTYNTNAPEAQWLTLAGSRDFCTFLAQADSTGFQSHIEIALDTLYADKPSLAVLAYLEPVALPPFTGANPSTLYCSKLGGTDIWGGQNNAAGGGWVTEAPDSATNFQVVGMCMFPDGSTIDSWGLTYKANGVIRGTDLSKVVRYQPTTLPNVFVGGSGENQPAESAVDKMLTDSDKGSNVSLKVGDTLTVELKSNPSTGYSWHVSANDETVLQQVGEPQFDLGNQTPVPGAGGTQTFTFKAVGKGKTTLTLLYTRPWETTVTPTPDDTWSVNVTVE
jgi:predicted secreted protein/putative hemolysin